MKVRKMVAGLAAVSMLAAFSAQAVLAADGVTISAEKVSAKAGADFTLNVELGDVPASGISVMEFAVTYDPAIVSVTGVTAGKITENGVDAAEKLDGAPAFGAEYATAGLVTFTYSTAMTDASYFITDSGVFATISGKVADGAKVGDSTKVEIVAIDRAVTEGSSNKNKDIKAGYIDAEGNATKYTISVSSGSVTVVGDEQPTEDQPTSGEQGKLLYGDTDCNGTVNLVDVVLLNKNLMVGTELTPQGVKNADVDNSGKLDAVDSLNILKACIDLITLPV